MYLSSGYLPPELWLVIAAHLSPGEISQLARLCRPFAALAYERNEGHISTLRLPVHTSVEGDTPDMDRNDEASSVRDFVNMLKQTMCVCPSCHASCDLTLGTASATLTAHPESEGCYCTPPVTD